MFTISFAKRNLYGNKNINYYDTDPGLTLSKELKLLDKHNKMSNVMKQIHDYSPISYSFSLI